MQLKIGILGTRGIPNAYGGFEEFAEHLSKGLVEKGHEVSVYCSSNHPWQQKNWNGVELIYCKDPENKIGTAGQFLYDLNCLKHASTRNFDILLQLGYTSNSVWWRRWPRNMINVLNMDGLEWKRTKYSVITRRFLKKAESLAALHADHLIADSMAIREYLYTAYKKYSTFIPYGAEIFLSPDEIILDNYKLKAHHYYLLIARMEPENNIELVIQSIQSSGEKLPLVVIGNTITHFGKRWKKKYASENIRFLGGIYDRKVLNNLRYYSKIYFHGHSVGGTNPSLLEAMACSCNIAAHDNCFNRAVLGDEAYYFKTEKNIHQILLQVSEENDLQKKKMNLEKIRTHYNWAKIITSYENLFLNLVKQKQ
ncbi:MAG: glycosyltransferase family 1 protein [Chitinophagaceae bacterium]